MNYFEDWYSQPNDANEQDQEKLLASMLAAAAANIPTDGLQNDPQVNSGLASDPANFINRIVENNTIPQLVNRGIADINSWFEEPNDLPGKDWSLKDFLRKPEEPLGDLGFFDRNVQENPTSNLTGSSGLDDFFWGGLRNESNLEAQLPRADRLFNSGPILGSQAGDTANQWNSPAEAGKDSDTKNATITLKKYSTEYNIQVDKRYPYQDQIDAFNKWFNSLNPKPTEGTFNMKIVPSGTPGSEHGIQLPGGFRLVPPTEVELKGEWKFNTPRDLEDIKNIFKK